MAGSATDDPRLLKLDMVIKKGDMIIGMLDKKGIQTDLYKDKFSKARKDLENGNIEEAFVLATECIREIKDLRVIPTEKEVSGRVRKGKGVFALIRDNTVEMEKKIDEWKMIISSWRKKGYMFENDDSLFTRTFDQIEKRFISIGEQIEKAEGIGGGSPGIEKSSHM